MPEPSVGIMLAGRAFHAVAEHAERTVILGRGLPSPEDLDDLLLKEWAAQVKEEASKETFLYWDWGDDTEESMREDYRALVRVAREDAFPAVKPVFVEHDIKLRLESPVGGFLCYGVIDVVEEGGAFVDWKTVDRPPKDAEKVDIQFAAYAVWAAEYARLESVPARKIFLVRDKKKRKPYVSVIKYNILPHHRRWFREVAAEVWKAIQADAYIPNPHGWWCSSGWCSFYDACPTGGGR